jgi:hypothetical protein
LVTYRQRCLTTTRKVKGRKIGGTDGWSEALVRTVRFRQRALANDTLQLRRYVALVTTEAKFAAMYEADLKSDSPSTELKKLMRAISY